MVCFLYVCLHLSCYSNEYPQVTVVSQRELKTKMKDEIQGGNVVLVQDEWSDIHNTTVIASSINCDGSSYFLSAVNTGTNKKNAQYCTNVALEAQTEATEFF